MAFILIEFLAILGLAIASFASSHFVFWCLEKYVRWEDGGGKRDVQE